VKLSPKKLLVAHLATPTVKPPSSLQKFKRRHSHFHTHKKNMHINSRVVIEPSSSELGVFKPGPHEKSHEPS
jgi:hypothetical protein